MPTAEEQQTQAPGNATAQEPEEQQTQGDSQGQHGEEPIRLPENPYNFLQEILKTPLGDGKYEIAKEAPKRAFKGRGSTKTLAQTAKKQLVELGVIKILSRGGSNKRAVVELVNDNVVMNNEGRGRKVGSRATSTRKVGGRKKAGKVVMNSNRKGATRKGGRKAAATSTSSKRTGNGGGRGNGNRGGAMTHRGGRKPNYMNVLDSLFRVEEDPQAFKADMKEIADKYPSLFPKFIQALKA